MRPNLLVLAVALVSSGLFLASLRIDWAARLEAYYLDAWHRLAGKRFTLQHATLVIIDDASLARHADTPLVFWTPLFAQAVETLRAVGARVVVLDFIFSGSPEAWLAKLGAGETAEARQYDRAFRQMLHGGGVVLAAYLVGEGESVADFILPSPDYLLSLPNQDLSDHVGLANLNLDADSIVRHYRARFSMSPALRAAGLPEYTLAASVARHAGLASAPESRSRIVFAGPPGSFPTLSFAALLETDAASRPEIRSMRVSSVRAMPA